MRILLSLIIFFFTRSLSFKLKTYHLTANIPSPLILNAEKNKSAQPPEDKKSKLTLGGVIQLITMGAGAPMLGEFKEVDENGKMMFELEANNYLSELRAKNFQDGWVEESADAISKPPGFFQNLLSGGKLMEDWDKKNRK